MRNGLLTFLMTAEPHIFHFNSDDIPLYLTIKKRLYDHFVHPL